MLDWDRLLQIEFLAIGVFILSFIITYLAIPRIIFVVKNKNLMDSPNSRSSHVEQTPTLGGVAFFLSLVVSSIFLESYDSNNVVLSIVAGLTVLFFVGLKDDLVVITPKTKIVAQLLAVLFLLINGDFYSLSFSGFLGLNTTPYWIAIAFGCFVTLSIINSYNLIDGINGSASMVGIVIFSCFSYLFFSANLYFYFLLSIVCVGFLLAFLRYNLSETKKIFMGDTGSMIVGFVIGIMTLKFLTLTTSELEMIGIIPINKFIVIIGLLFIPFVDTLRVFTIRVFKRVSPFKPDRNHVHHVMIDYMKLSHPKASFILAIVNLFSFVTLFYFNINFSTKALCLLLFFMIVSFSCVLFYFNKSYEALKSKQKIKDVVSKASNGNLNLF